MEAARCLRHLYVNQIKLSDLSMGLDVDLVDIFDLIFDDDNNKVNDDSTLTTEIPLKPNTNLQPIINIINSNVTIANTPHRHIVYDDDDNIKFVFEKPAATADDYDDMPEINFDDIGI
jgi:hypothetical protein